MFCYYSHQPLLPADQLYRLSLVRKEIRLEDAKPINRKLPIKRELIQRGLTQHWKVTESACDLLLTTITLFDTNTMGSYEGTRSSQITMVVPSVSDDPINLVRQQKTVVDLLYSLWIIKVRVHTSTCVPGSIFMVYGVSRPATSFPTLLSLVKTRQLYFSSINASLRSRLDAMLTAVGENPTLYSVHSLRTGGATELFLSGASMTEVQMYGRWKSESALIYFRDASGIVFSCIGGY